ncbi:MAG: hypothetical protein ABI253_11025 [Mycobacterium sp.]
MAADVEADAVIDTWRPDQNIDIFAQLRSAIRRSAIESLAAAGQNPVGPS